MDEKQKERLRSLIVEFLLEVRAAYLRAGGSPLKHWDQMQNRMRSAARRTSSPAEWATQLLRGLQLPAPSSLASQALLDLDGYVREAGVGRAWLALIELEYGLLMALTRKCAEQRREAREETSQ